MSVLVSTDAGFVVSHEDFIRRTYKHVEMDGSVYSFKYNPAMFQINTPFKRMLEAQKAAELMSDEKGVRNRKRKKPCAAVNAIAQRVQEQARSLVATAQEKGLFAHSVKCDDLNDNNSQARQMSDTIYKTTGSFNLPTVFSGANATSEARLEVVGDQQFLFPKESRFFCNDVLKMQEKVVDLGTFDLVIIDPPWWNKYIRRKRAHEEVDGYKMLSCDDLAKIPVAGLLHPGALVAVWCTNSESHLSDLQNHLMPAWGIKHVASWCWLKVTTSGEPVCPYADPPGKQPFEQLLFGVEASALEGNRAFPHPSDEQLFMSVPSAVHSHKPPLLEMLQPFLPPEPRCLEIFARSLLPRCTSWGLEVLKLQHISLFNFEQLGINSPSEVSTEAAADEPKVSTVFN